MSFEQNIRHADQVSGETYDYDDEQQSILQSLEVLYPNYDRADWASRALASYMLAERERRQAHYFRYRLVTGRIGGPALFDESEYHPESALLDMARNVDQASLNEARILGSKGVAFEVAHVDQYGNWNPGAHLDAVLRELPESEVLRDAGVEMSQVYESRDDAKITYNATYTDANFLSPEEPALFIIRKRAAADMKTKDGDTIEIIKKSVFLVDHSRLPQSERQAAIDAIDNHDGTSDAGVGKLLIEPRIRDRRLRSVPVVLPATTLAFGLRRFDSVTK